MVHEVLGVKIALGDHRSSFPTTQNVLDLLTQIRVGGMIAGKIGVLHIHLGNVPGAFEMFEEIINRGFPIRHIRPTHCARDKYVQPAAPAALKALQMQSKPHGMPELNRLL